MVQEQETIAELQARYDKLELKAAELKGKADEVSKLKVENYRREQAEIKAGIKLQQNEEQMEHMKQIEAQRREQDADGAVELMVKKQLIGPRENETMQDWRQKFIDNPSLIPAVTGIEAGSALPSQAIMGGRGNGKLTEGANKIQLDGANGGDYSPISGGRSIQGALKKYYELTCENSATDISGHYKTDGMLRKGQLAREMAAIFKADLGPKECVCRWEDMTFEQIGTAVGLQARSSGRRNGNGNGAIQAADFTDANLGTLSGTLVLQRTLPVFAYEFPELQSIYTDFSDTPGLLNQAEATRIVTQAPVQKYDTTLDAAGRPKGWSNVVAMVTTDVLLTLTDYVSVPVVFSNAQLGSTTRRLFDEQSVLAIKALAQYFVAMLTNLATSGNYNAYAVGGTALVPTAYPTYAQGYQNFSVADLNAIGAAFDSNKVPVKDRGMLLNSQYFGKLANDPLLYYMYMGSAGNQANRDSGASQFLSERQLPKLKGFAAYNAPYMPTQTPATPTGPNPLTPNVVGFAFQKAAAIVKSRLPTDFTTAIDAPIPGTKTTVTDPDTKISLMLVQYISLRENYAEWRPEVQLGTAVGDKRAGLVMTSV